MHSVLVVEDDKRMKELLKEILEGEGYNVTATENPKEALLFIKESSFDIVLTDLKMPEVEGTEILKYTQQISPDSLVIIITAHGTIESAIECMKSGAYDFIQKPFEPDQIVIVLKRASKFVDILKENKRLSENIDHICDADIIGNSGSIEKIKHTINQAAPLEINILVEGETGTGKELVAKSIHKNSKRSNKKFLAINCGSITETLLETELFGHEKGAFTGASYQRKGLLETANGGTIFLDEINSTSESFQVSLLRAIEDQQIYRVGSSKPIDTDVRLIFASNKDLSAEVEKGNFRRDLYYRINLMPIKLPPLRERVEDIPLLSYYFLNKKNKKYSKNIKEILVDVINCFKKYHWPGNVRELENVIERSVVMEIGDVISLSSIPDEIKNTEKTFEDFPVLMKIDEMEKYLIKKTLSAFEGNKSKTAHSLGIDPATLWRKINKYNLQ